MYNHLFKQLQPTDCIITVNRRLAQFLQNQYADYLISQHRPAVFESSQIIALSDWLDQMWWQVSAEHNRPEIILTEQQEWVLWQQIISQSDYAENLLSIDQAIAPVQQAWQLMQHWQLEVNDLNYANQVDVQAFGAWAKSFDSYCQNQHWLTAAALPNVLLQSRSISKLPTLYLAGFTDVAPVFKALFDQVSCDRQFVKLPPEMAACYQIMCHDSQQERQQACVWAKQVLGQGPDKRLAIVVPDLHQCRQAWLDTVSDCLLDQDIAVNISGGQPLGELSIVQAALNILRLVLLDDVRQLIVSLCASPFCSGGISESNQRAQWSRQLLAECHQPMTLRQIITMPSLAQSCPILYQGLSALVTLECIDKQPLLDWVQYFCQAWQCLGWPGECYLNREQYQLIEEYYQLLQDWPGLQLVTIKRVTLQQALHWWQQALNRHLFQAKTLHQPQLEILGLLEVVGLSFDAIWVCDMQAQTLPQPVDANPFLPLAWQRQQHMPHATAERQWQYATHFLAQVQMQCQQLYCSYPQWQDDQPLIPSQLIVNFPEHSLDEFYQQFRQLKQPAAVALEQLVESQVPPIDDQVLQASHYHSGLFQAQALCPFQAMARYRWQAKSIESAPDYLDLRLRGLILHDILQHIWQQLGHQDALLSLLQDKQRCTDFVTDHIVNILQRWSRRYPCQLTEAVCQIEQQRLQQLLIDWLVLESERPAFEVLAEEQLLFGSIGPLHLQLRIDRMDQLASGQKIVLDYKTGVVTPKSWFGDRLSDPQLPIYAVLSNSDGVVYAQLNPRSVGWSGIAHSDQWFADVVEAEKAWRDWAVSSEQSIDSWSDLLVYWRRKLTDLAEQFSAGYAAVDPKSGSSVCQYCDLHMLCRIGDKS